MDLKNIKKITFLKLQLSGAIFILIVLLISSFFVFGPSFEQVALALNPTDYNKAAGDTLNVADWNRLDDDFVAKSGDTMTGPLILSGNPTQPMQAATMNYVDDEIATVSGAAGSMITDESGNQLKMVCGRTPITMTNCQIYDASNPQFSIIKVNVSTVVFTSTPSYFTNLTGSYSYSATGYNNIYPYDANNGFQVRIQYIGVNRDGRTFDPVGNLDCAYAVAKNWSVNWCAVGN